MISALGCNPYSRAGEAIYIHVANPRLAGIDFEQDLGVNLGGSAHYGAERQNTCD